MKNKSEILRLHSLFADQSAQQKYFSELLNKRSEAKKQYNSIINEVPFVLHEYDPNDLLCNIPYSIKDNICTKGITTTGGSLLLENYVPLFDAHVSAELKKTNALLISKDALDEFGLGGTGQFCAYGLVKNPHDPNFITAGSSSGSNVNVAIGLSAFAICTDTGDSIRHPACFLGNAGLKPSYGLVSRYGVYPYSPSLDTVGVVAKYVTDIAIVLSKIAKHDEKDFTNVYTGDINFYENLKATDLSKVKIAYLKSGEKYMPEHALASWRKYLSWLKTKVHIEEIELDDTLIQALLPAYVALSFGEASTSLGDLTGVTFGRRISGVDYEDSITKTRTAYYGNQLKKRLTVGAYCLLKEHRDDLFINAKKVRRLAKEWVDNTFKKYDCYFIPGTGTMTLTFEELKNPGMNCCDDLLLLGNFCGIPSLTIPAINENPRFLGMNINANNFEDQKLLNIGLALENLNEEYKNLGEHHE